MSRSRLVPFALGVTLLVAMVAVAARGKPLGARGGSGGALPFSFWDYTYTTIVIVLVPLLITGVFALLLVRRREGKRRPFWQSMLRTIVILTAVVGLELLVVRHLRHLRLHSPSSQQTETSQIAPKHGPGHSHGNSASANSLRFQWDELAIVLGLIAVVGAIVAMHLRRRREEPETPREVLAAALDESLDDLRADPDLRRAIIAAYARMERALAAAGIPRHPAEAPLEYLERSLGTLHASAGSVRRLTDLFEWARFSHHEPEPSMRDEAVDALGAVRDELRAGELAPA